MVAGELVVRFGLCLLASGLVAAVENSTLTTTSFDADIENLESMQSSGDGGTETLTDDEDGFGVYDDDYYYDDEDDDTEYSWAEETGVSSEWEGFDGITCHDGMRFGKDKICDGVPDCHDCSDEENCTDASAKIFMCYTKGQSTSRQDHSLLNPKCIELNRYCDGIPDCANTADERYTGPGFRCPVKRRFRSCVLPQDLTCDGVTHCEDESDVCPEQDDTDANTEAELSVNETKSALDTPDTFFRCLNTGMLISTKQVCDGRFDCLDLSDECLCEVRRSLVVRRVCDSLCAKPVWTNQAPNRNCEHCSQGEIYWNAAEESTVFLNITDEEKTCFSSAEMVEISYTSVQDTKQPSYEIIECLDLTLTGATVRARKCDGRPECFFGEDECGIDCRDGGHREWTVGSGEVDGDPGFCRLLTADMTGYACLSWLNEDHTRKRNLSQLEMIYFNRRISVCDGLIECKEDGSDEAFCPTRRRCAEGTNDTNTQTYDVAQRCDGFSHCYNGKDEDPADCPMSARSILPCDSPVNDEMGETFRFEDFLDGRKQCDNGADECPPFLNQIPEIWEKVVEGKARELQMGISSHSRAIDSLALQIYIIAAAFVGISALAVSLALGLYNVTVAWRRFCLSEVTERSVWVRSCLVYAREVAVNLGVTVAKVLVCAYFAMIRIKRSEEANYSLHDLSWRSSYFCDLLGAVMLVGSQVPVFALACFAGGYVLFRDRHPPSTRSRKTAEKNREDELHGVVTNENSEIMSSKERLCLKLRLALSCLVLVILIWLPVVILAILLTLPSGLNDRVQTYGWVRATGASKLFRANLLDGENASRFAGTLAAIRNRSFESTSKGHFTFPDFHNVVDSVAPSLGVKFYGSYGYFSHSGTCLPAFLVHASGGEAPFDVAVSNSWTWGVSVAILVVDFVLIFFTAVLTSRFGAGLCRRNCWDAHFGFKQKHSILNHTFSRLVLTEALTWLFVATLFFMKVAAPDSFTDYTYAVSCIVIIGLNCGIVTPFVLLARKFKLRRILSSETKSRSLSHPVATRIIEVNEEEDEQAPFTNGGDGSALSGMKHVSEEHQELMKHNAAHEDAEEKSVLN